MNQAELLSKYNLKYRDEINHSLFERSDDEIIDQLKKVILSCQRNSTFVIKVNKFTVVDDYAEINRILYHNEESNKARLKKKYNTYEFINLKDSDIRLLIVNYHLEIKDTAEDIDVIIAVPRIVNKYYFRIGGNIYSSLYQIVENTYNNATSANARSSSITVKTMFMPIRMYKDFKSIKTTKDETINCARYYTNLFNKFSESLKYILAKYGFYGTCKFIGIEHVYITEADPDQEDMYTFCCNKNENIFISVPKYLFDNDHVVQSYVYTIIAAVMRGGKTITANDVCGINFWLASLGSDFNAFTAEKGQSVLDSFETIMDINTQESLRLPEEVKSDIYGVLLWMVREFKYIRGKENIDISFKKIRFGEYIASLYAMKVTSGIYRVGDMGKRADIKRLKQALNTIPTFLLTAITKCKLVNYRNETNDMDSLTALKYTYKGVSGLGEGENNSIPTVYRHINTSHLGRLDLDSSSNSDPGVSGTLCPCAKIYEGGYFSNYEEPNYWNESYKETMQNFKSLKGLKEIAEFQSSVLEIDTSEDLKVINESMSTMQQLINPIYFTND